MNYTFHHGQASAERLVYTHDMVLAMWPSDAILK
jgi:hypothetical protein